MWRTFHREGLTRVWGHEFRLYGEIKNILAGRSARVFHFMFTRSGKKPMDRRKVSDFGSGVRIVIDLTDLSVLLLYTSVPFHCAACHSIGQKGAIPVMDPEKLLEENPGSAVFPRYADHLAREGRTSEAVNVLKKGIQANPFLASGYAVLADILFRLESEEEAVENLMNAIKIDPQRPRDLLRLGEYFRERDPEKAGTFLRAANMYEPEAAVTSAGMPVEKDEVPGIRAETEFGERLSGETLSGETIPDIVRESGALPVEPEPQEFFEKPLVEEMEEEQAPSPVIGGYGVEHAEEDLEALFTSLGGEGISEGSFPVDTAGIEEQTGGADRLPGGGSDERTGITYASPDGEGLAAEFGVVDIEGEDSGDEKVLEIEEEGEYDLARFGFGSSEEEGTSVLGEEERAELLALSSSVEGGLEGAGPSDFEERPESGAHEPAETDTGEDHKVGEVAPEPAAGLFSRLSFEELEVLSTIDREPPRREGDLDEETRDGIDYTDVLSELIPSEETKSVSPLEAEPLDNMLGSLGERVADVLEGETPLKPEDARTGLGEPGGRGIEEEPPRMIPVDEWDAAERYEFLPGSGETPELTEDETALISDFVTGREPEPAIEEPAAHAGAVTETIEGLAADFAVSVSGLPETVTGVESLDDLLSAYVRVLESAPESLLDADAPPSMAVFPVPADAGSENERPRPAPRHTEGYTATMAEIYATQGFISRAIEIYTVLAERNPENETFRNRLAELKTIYEQHPDA
jgi:hypothetical protein